MAAKGYSSLFSGRVMMLVSQPGNVNFSDGLIKWGVKINFMGQLERTNIREEAYS